MIQNAAFSFTCAAILLLSACGNDDSSPGAISLTVRLFDSVTNGPASGESVNITDDTGGIDFTCSQSPNTQPGTVDGRCATVQVQATGQAAEIAIAFHSLPVGRTYTLAHVDTFGGAGSRGGCVVGITTVLEIQSGNCTVSAGPNTVILSLT